MESDLNSVFIRLTESARMGAAEYASAYSNALPDILHLYEAKRGTACEVRAQGIEDMSMAIKSSLLYNEIITMDIIHNSGEISISGYTKKAFENLGIPEKITITVPVSRKGLIESAISGKGVNFGFLTPSGDDVDRFLLDLAPLVAHGRLIPRPGRILLVATDKPTPKGGTTWEVLEASPGSSLDAWTVAGEHDAFAEPVATESALAAEMAAPSLSGVAGEIILPYLVGVSLTDYAKIIVDEHDIIVEFRSAIKQLIEEYHKGTKTISEFKDDVVEPRIAKINRSFGKISSMGRLRVGGSAIATVVLTLATYSSAGLAAAVAAVGGTAGFISTVKEAADRAEKLRTLKDDPLHLLWKLKRAK